MAKWWCPRCRTDHVRHTPCPRSANGTPQGEARKAVYECTNCGRKHPVNQSCPIRAKFKRPDYYRFYNTAWWKDVRLQVLEGQPFCAHCKTEASVDVDHIKPHWGDRDVFFDIANLQGLCKRCHAIKTAGEMR